MATNGQTIEEVIEALESVKAYGSNVVIPKYSLQFRFIESGKPAIKLGYDVKDDERYQ